MKYTNRADLLIAAGESIKMQKKAGIEPYCKCSSNLLRIVELGFVIPSANIEFPLAVVEGKPVFVGDELYYSDGSKATVGYTSQRVWIENNCSWNPPKPKTVMVELRWCDVQTTALDGWQAATSASDARYQARIKELEDALRSINEEITDRMDDGDFCRPSLVRAINSMKKTIINFSTATPDTALQKALFEAELKGAIKAQASGDNAFHYVNSLTKQLSALNRNETLGE